MKIRECNGDWQVRSRRTLFHGTCTCCCIQTIVGAIAGLQGDERGKQAAIRRYGAGSPEVEQNAKFGCAAGALLALIAPLCLAPLSGLESFFWMFYVAIPGFMLFGVIGPVAAAYLFDGSKDAAADSVGRRIVLWRSGVMLGYTIAATGMCSTVWLFLFGLPAEAIALGIASALIGSATVSHCTSEQESLPAEKPAIDSAHLLKGGSFTTPSTLPVRQKKADRGPAAHPAKNLALTEEHLIMHFVESVLSNEEAHCPVCGGRLGEKSLTSCASCETPHHETCWQYNGGCAIFGCGNSKQICEIDFHKLKGTAYDWFWLSRLRWWAYLAMAFSVAATPIAYALTLETKTATVFLQMAGTLFVLFAALSLPALRLRRRLTAAVTNDIEPNRRAIDYLANRLASSRSEPLLQRLAYHLPLPYAIISGIIGVVALCRTPLTNTDALLILIGYLIGGLICAHISHRARRRQAVIEAVTGRIITSAQTQRRLQARDQ